MVSLYANFLFLENERCACVVRRLEFACHETVDLEFIEERPWRDFTAGIVFGNIKRCRIVKDIIHCQKDTARDMVRLDRLSIFRQLLLVPSLVRKAVR
jgi:hypothetical protein